MENSKFVFDILSQVLVYRNNSVPIIFDDKGQPWFKLSDLLNLLGYTSIVKQSSMLNISKENKKSYNTIKVRNISSKDIIKPKHNTHFVNESGLYEILNNSKKQIAVNFRSEIFDNILPTLRKTGQFIMGTSEKKQLKLINDALKEQLANYKKELNYYYDKYKFEPSEHGYIYINEVHVIVKGETQIGYKPGFCTDMKKRKYAYQTGNFNYKLIAYIPINIDKSKIENCYLNVFKEHKLKPNTKTELLCFLSLEKLKNGIIACIKMLGAHTCECVCCKEKYDVKNLDKHKCMKKLINHDKFIDYELETLLANNARSKGGQFSIVDATAFLKQLNRSTK